MQFKSKWQREAIPKCINTWQRVEFCSTEPAESSLEQKNIEEEEELFKER